MSNGNATGIPANEVMFAPHSIIWDLLMPYAFFMAKGIPETPEILDHIKERKLRYLLPDIPADGMSPLDPAITEHLKSMGLDDIAVCVGIAAVFILDAVAADINRLSGRAEV